MAEDAIAHSGPIGWYLVATAVSVFLNGFFVAANEELLPIESAVPGVFFAGASLGPKDIPETVAQASGAAAKALALLQRIRSESMMNG